MVGIVRQALTDGVLPDGVHGVVPAVPGGVPRVPVGAYTHSLLSST